MIAGGAPALGLAAGGAARRRRARRLRAHEAGAQPARPPRRRSWNSSASPVNTGSVPAGSDRVGPWSPSRVQRRPSASSGRRGGGRAAAPRRASARAQTRPDEVEPARRVVDRASSASRRRRPSLRAPASARVEGELEHAVVAAARAGHGGTQAPAQRRRARRLQGLPTGEGTTHDQCNTASGGKDRIVARPGGSCTDATGAQSGQRAAQHDVVRRRRVAEPLADAVDQALQLGVLERVASCRSGRRSRGGDARRSGRPARSRRRRRRRSGARA